MKDFHALPEVIKSFLIASAGGGLRYLSNLLINKILWNWKEFVVWLVLGGGIGVLVGLIVPNVIEDVNMQYAVIYTSGMMSIEIIKLIINHGPNLIDKFFNKHKHDFKS